MSHDELLRSVNDKITDAKETLATGIKWNRLAIVGLFAIGAWVVLRVDSQIEVVTARFESFQDQMGAAVAKLESSLDRTASAIDRATTQMVHFDRTMDNVARTQDEIGKSVISHVTKGAHGTAAQRLDQLEAEIQRLRKKNGSDP